MPQPKSGAANNSTTSSLDVAAALKSVVAPTTNVSTTAAPAKSDASVTTPVEDLTPKSEKIETTSSSTQPTTSIIELRLAPETSEMTVGEKRQFVVQLDSDAPLGLAVMMLRFDPRIIKINSVSAGKLFADSKSAPTLTQSMDQNGMLLVSLA